MIYLDLVFAVNLVMDWLILWTVALCLRLSFSFRRLTAGALIGALYGVVLLLPPLTWLATFGAKLLLSLLMTWMAFAWKSWQLYLRILGVFYLISFLAGGAVVGGAYLLQDAKAFAGYNGVLTLVNLPVAWLLVGVGSLLLISLAGVSWYRNHYYKVRYSVPLIVCFGEKRIGVRALVDTGNHLRDPFNQRPVIVMEYEVLKPFLPAELNCMLQATRGHKVQGLEQYTRLLKGTSWETRVRILPFHSLGNRQGLMLGLAADEVFLEVNGKSVYHRNVVIGVYHGFLSREQQYQALLHPELLQAEAGTGKGVA
ncbi:MAG: sigma-E processing peptidase SpoIIGA [Clostridia bacterium]|nr:sigma-E processing peptidase SpoIIGA [Clostridia bacterium]